MDNKIKVVIVDDSLSIRLLLRGIIAENPDMEVVGMAEDPLEARKVIRETNPDVITLDVEMPKMDGLTFLEKLMKLKPTPVVMISTLTNKGSRIAMQALELGAVDIVGKPSQKAEEIDAYRDEITEKVRAAAYANVGQGKGAIKLPNIKQLDALEISPTKRIDEVYPHRRKPRANANSLPLIAIGASTGGPCTLKKILNNLPDNLPPIVIVQHMSAMFTKALAVSMNDTSPITVVEATDGMPIQRGHAYIAPGGRHLAIAQKSTGDYICRLLDFEKVNRHRPAVDMLFRSVSDDVGKKATAVLLTGMGDDGAIGLKELRDCGANTIAQDEASCVVYGMPKVAINMGAAKEILNIEGIIKRLADCV